MLVTKLWFLVTFVACTKKSNTSQWEPGLSLRCHAHRPLAKHLMHILYLSGNIWAVLNSSSDWLNYTGFQGDVCVAFFNVPPGNKDAVAPNPLTKKESHWVYKCDRKGLLRSTKCWIFKSMWNIQSLWHRIFKIHPRISHTHRSVIMATFPCPETWCWTKWKFDWLFDMSVKQLHVRALASECGYLYLD